MSNVVATRSKNIRPRISLQSLHKEVQQLRERVQDLEDLKELSEAIARNKGKRLIAWDEAKKDLGIEN